MAMKKPDAFTKMIVPMLGTKDLLGKNGKYLSSEVAKLLRAHHRKIVRMVQGIAKNSYDDYQLACDDILAKLTQMKGL